MLQQQQQPRKMLRSSFSHNPLLRVSRPVSACSRCRAAKVKCDGKLPACTACEKAGREAECSSANDQFARGRERSYVAALELRIEKLERRLAFARSQKASSNLAVGDHDGDRKGSLAVIQQAMHRKAERRRENSDVNSLVSDFGYLSVNATAHDFEFNATNMTFARLVLAAATNEFIHPPTDTDMPSKEAMVTCLQFYLNNIFCLFPCFAEKTLWATMEDLLENDGRIIKDSDCFLFWVVLAIGATAQSRENGDQFYTMGVDYVARALPYADKAMMSGYVGQIQSLVLLTQYAMLDPAHFDAWHLIGFASRAAIDLGYHQDPDREVPGEREKLNQRRRIFYCVYALDRAISMVHARAFSFTDDAINVVIPKATIAKPAEQAPATNNGAPPSSAPSPPPLILPAQHLFQLRRTQSLWYQTLFQSDDQDISDTPSFIWKMCADMKDWNSSLPSTQPAFVGEYFDLELRYSYVYCIAPSARAPQITDYSRVLIFEHTTAYLETIHRIAKAAMSAAFYTYHDALKVYFMASQFLAVLRDAEDMLLMGAPVQIPVVNPGCPPPLPLPSRVYLRGRDEENLDRSLRVLQLVVETLELFGRRWTDALSLKNNFQMISNEVVERLHVKQQVRDSARMQQQHQQQGQVMSPRPDAGPTGQGQVQVQVQGQGQGSPSQWVGVNVAQMMHGGP
ncbi:hypothetical protein CFIMG_006199RA [Ceratocystis fimbriata CBS 114723]|uniref:Zn(2)-C6 fungal-type domain-containing protein n=1 Tax=Ceratocystis fimbriata CBS 114723 TaxID=1035309 RepID=A0A2C5WZ11_9PEZI|nr:hypothetical protein CFIMG_006199RA [Ceratocystis fimbriata CBS 114723]